MVDYRPVKRVDVYGGVAYSAVTGGMASGYQYANNTQYSVGVKVGF